MKDHYPNYFQRMREIESKISKQDRQIIDDYLKFCSLSAGSEKVEQRKRYAIQFLDIAEKSFKDFDRNIIEGIYLAIKNADRETSGKNEAIKNLKYFIRWLTKDANLLEGLKPVTQRKGYNTSKINPSTLPTDSEIKMLIKASKNNLMHVAMISLQTELALRPHELLGLKWKDVTIEGEVGEVKVFASKTQESRVLPFKDSIIHIERWREAYPHNIMRESLVFPNPLTKKPLYRTYVSSLYRRLSKQAGIRHLYPYLFRHSRLTKMNGKLPGKVAAAYGGHSEKTAGIYTHLSEADIRSIVLKEIYAKEPEIVGSKKLKKELQEIKKNFENTLKVNIGFLEILKTLKGTQGKEFDKVFSEHYKKIDQMIEGYSKN